MLRVWGAVVVVVVLGGRLRGKEEAVEWGDRKGDEKERAGENGVREYGRGL